MRGIALSYLRLQCWKSVFMFRVYIADAFIRREFGSMINPGISVLSFHPNDNITGLKIAG